MLGSEYNWILSPTRTARGLSVRLARGSLLTLAVGAFCLSCVLLPPTFAPTSAVAAAAPATATLKETAQSELPRALLRLWVFVPYVLPQR